MKLSAMGVLSGVAIAIVFLIAAALIATGSKKAGKNALKIAGGILAVVSVIAFWSSPSASAPLTPVR